VGTLVPPTDLKMWTDPASSRSPMVHALNDWFLARRGLNGLVDRSALDPAEITPLLPYLMLTDVEAEPFRIRYRLVGTTVVACSGVEFTGRYLDEILTGGTDTSWIDYYRKSYDLRCPIFGAANETTKRGLDFRFEFAMFPLTKGGDEIRQFVAIEEYFDFKYQSDPIDPWTFVGAGPLARSA
jgi:hypothetical protein